MESGTWSMPCQRSNQARNGEHKEVRYRPTPIAIREAGQDMTTRASRPTVLVTTPALKILGFEVSLRHYSMQQETYCESVVRSDCRRASRT